MCTAMHIQTAGGGAFLGRTMDFSQPLDPELYFAPRGYEWRNFANTHRINDRYGFLGIGQDASLVNFADGVNEMGLAAAALYFPGYAQYGQMDAGDGAGPAIAANELIKFLLGLCATVGEAASILGSVRIVGTEDSVTGSVAPLHWILADRSGSCLTVEKTARGLQLLDNPIGVLTNSPDFSWHMTNLRNYMDVTPEQQEARRWGSVALTPFGQGAGTFGLPGDAAPPSRFVRTAYLKSHAEFPSRREEAVEVCFHVLESVSIPKGTVVTQRGTSDYTQYTALMDLNAGAYFFKTYENSRIFRAGPPAQPGRELISLGKLAQPLAFGQLPAAAPALDLE